MKLKSFPTFGTRLWNCVHPDWRKLTKRAFKRKIHKLLLTVLEIEDYYVDAHSLILNLKTSNYRPLSRGGHFESQGNKKLCFCTSSLALNERLDVQNLLFEHCVIKVYYTL